MIKLFFSFYCKNDTGSYKQIIYSFFACCGGPLYGPAVYTKIRNVRETGFTSKSPRFKKSELLNGRF
jgi:hypothetical protein